MAAKKGKPAKAKAKPRTAKPAARKARASPLPREPMFESLGASPAWSAPRAVSRQEAHPAPAVEAAPDNERDYLVIFEEPDPYGLPSDDSLVLDIETQNPSPRGEVDVRQKLDLDLTNTTNWMGTLGFVTTMVGALLGVGLMIGFTAIYPDNWYSSPNSVRIMILLSVLCLALMIAGVVLTHYGRRIQARGVLRDMRIVEKTSQPRAAFE
jgi:hypothetical protein